MAASQPGWFNFFALTNLSDLADGYRLYTYVAGTTTHKVAFTDAAASVAHTYTSDGSGGQYIALDARGEIPAPLFLTSGGYDLALKTTAGATVWTRRAIGQNDAAISLDAALRAELVSKASAGVGAGMIGFDPTLNYAANTIGRSVAGREWNPRDFPWLAKFDNATDDTAAIQACWQALFDAGGGTMVLPRGIARVTSIVMNYATGITVNVRGQGQHATYLAKMGATTTPVLDIKSNTGVLDVYSEFRGFQVLGANACDGIKLTTIANVTFERVEARVCGVALNLAGALVSSFRDCSFFSSATGVRTRKDSAVYCNSIRFYDCNIKANTSLGMDINHANDMLVWNCDIESNGTTVNLNTGAVIIRADVDEEVGISTITFGGGTHFEGNLGSNFVVAATPGFRLVMDGVSILSSEAGLAASIQAIESVSMSGVVAASPGDIVLIGGCAMSSIVDSNIATITDTSSSRIRRNVTTSSGAIKFGSSACGSATLVGGTKAVAYPAFKGTEKVLLTSQADGGTPGWLRITSAAGGVGFTINSSSGTDTSTVFWFVAESI